MKKKQTKPGQTTDATLAEIPRACIDETAAVEFLEKQRWGDSPACPRCGDTDVGMMQDKGGNRSKRYLWRCHGCKKQFTVRIGTIMEESRIPARVWCHAFWRACSSKKGVSALQISRECSITYKSALFLMHRIRFGMAEPNHDVKLNGTVEMDETYVGGKPRYKGVSKRGRGTKKTPVLGMVSRNGEIRTRVITRVTSKNLKDALNESVEPTAHLITDELWLYKKLGKSFAGHQTVTHSKKEYVRGDVHTNTIECFFSLVKRKFYGTHRAVSKKHLHRYISEAEFQWNTRHGNDGERITAAIRGADGKRLTYYDPKSESA